MGYKSGSTAVLLLFISGCAFGALDFTDNRSITIEHNQTKIEIKGDIIAVEDYIELNKLLQEIKRK